ncbi:ABC-F family ATP-binding cassette domain-containing protein, partial [Chitinophaga sp.]|uniref:ABC-F family ATP-binding cassette domain-containing protein n=1 Tax=Chitinophaga sp. TaxID=1869181 RepID=UPI00260CD8F6
MRVLLAKLILQQPVVLMLDEPTNHLDLPSIEWLERYLSNYDGAVIIVSHDRYFLDRMVNKIVELYQQELHHYAGNYEDYEEEKSLRRELQQRAFENQQDYIRQQERFIERFKAKASKAAQAQSIMKRLDRLERVEQVDNGPSKIRMNFSVDKIPGKILCTLNGVSKSYGPIKILENARAEINRGDKIALIGANGKGKSTLLRVIDGSDSYEGDRQPGHNVVTSFYAQHQLESLHLDNEILEELKSCASGNTEMELRGLLGAFLFQGDDVFKKIRILSGGEKARVALAKVIISKANFLLLDEPTNHLDMNSVDMLIDALGKYEGSLVLVSHDRYFVSRTANKIWEIVDGEIKEFDGTYTEWEEWKKRMAANAQPAKAEKEKKAAPAPVQQQKAPVDNTLKKELQKQQRQVQNLEKQLGDLKAKVQQLEADMANPDIYADKNKFKSVEASYKTASAELAKSMAEYESAFEKVMELEEKMQG